MIPASNRRWKSLEGRDGKILLVIFIIACALIFPKLGDRRLWQDEAETALIAVNVLHTGLPFGWDGRRLVTQNDGQEMTESYLWAWTPWLMHYIAAAGIAVGGENSFGARWPFALLGCVSFPLFYWLVRRMSDSRPLAIVAVALLLSSVQYLLLMRQCRYYALLPAAFFLSLAGYQALPTKRGTVALGIGLVLLFHSNYVSCAIAATGLLLHAALFRRTGAIWKQLIISGLILAAGAIPWIVGTGVASRASALTSAKFSEGLLGTILMSNRYVCPWLVIVPLFLIYRVKRMRMDGAFALCLCLIIPMFFFLPMFLWPNPRYVSFLLPIGALIEAHAVRALYAWKSGLGLALALFLAGSNVLIAPLPALLPTNIGRELFGGAVETGRDALALGLIKSELGGYAFEITHHGQGPDEELVSFVEQNTAEDDLIGITHNGLPIMFHTRRALTGLLSPETRERAGWDKLPPYLRDVSLARWIILRPEPFGPERMSKPEVLDALQREGVAIERVLHLDIDDTRWINNPLVPHHVFRPHKDSSEGIDVLLLSH